MVWADDSAKTGNREDRLRIHEMVGLWAELGPSHTAVLHAEGSMSFATLREEASRWAVKIAETCCSAGEASNALLPICMPAHSPWTVIAMLAVLEAGAAFVLVVDDLHARESVEERLLAASRLTNASCVILGPEEWGIQSLRDACPRAFCMGPVCPPASSPSGRLAERRLKLERRRHGKASDLAWGILGPGNDEMVLFNHQTLDSKEFGQPGPRGYSKSTREEFVCDQTTLSTHEGLLQLFTVLGRCQPILIAPSHMSEENGGDDQRELFVTPGQSEGAEPATAVLARLWDDVLCLPQGTTRLESKFLDLGGDSLKSAQLLSLARASGLELPVEKLFFGNPSLWEMASALTQCVEEELADSFSISGPETRLPLREGYDPELIPSISLPDWISPENVVRVVPATAWQAACIGNSTLLARPWTDCWCFNLYGAVSTERIREICSSLLESCEILRTVFTVFESNVMQVVLRHYPLVFTAEKLRSGETLHSRTMAFWESTKRGTANMDDRWVQFMLLEDPQEQTLGQQSRLLVRLTHAQYDAGCIPIVLRHMQAVYRGEVPKPMVQFWSFVAWANRADYKAAAEDFWTKKLEGSQLTQLLGRTPGPLASASELHTINRKLTSPKMSFNTAQWRRLGITASTVVLAAWAAALSLATGEDEVVFGNTTSGRHSGMVGIDNVVGPCWNVLPVRARLGLRDATGTSQTTCVDFLRSFQRDQQACFAHECLGFRDIVKHCTAWPASASPCSIINFENVEARRTGGDRLALGAGVEFDFVPLPGPVAGSDLWVAATPLPCKGTEAGHLILEIRFDGDKYSQDDMQMLLDLFCENALAFTQEQANEQLARVLGTAAERCASKSGGPCVNGQQVNDALAVRRAVNKLWYDMFKLSDCDSISCFQPASQIRCEPVIAAAIAQSLRRVIGVALSTEDVIAHPSPYALERVILNRLGDP
ncbi:hypothetical protein DHEL01_v212067 [Diaporthe helianthi]|uniref:Carrier domain-containing protein n=1 Tax=Diaporthe helianthi TaxID=158607 RepID=A0A2P5HH15_DIAHE|nr:hypothetical protein DHEL01_v212067 [Diaporthe helianthi]